MILKRAGAKSTNRLDGEVYIVEKLVQK